ncbi:LacI family DNA-binding transcriptional regulator [Enterocloster bolteae]|nr:LacI family DNA-binding transcriptional regulator [Enterocloster bolteae]UOX70517.1 LacI family DNA-binding transcriptional regulator [Enterocloster bolteae]
MEKRATIKDVARLAGVSISTASLAINGKEGLQTRPGRWYWMQ